MLLQVGLCPLWGPSGDKAGVLVVPYFDQWSKSFNAQLRKYVDDTTTSEVVAKGGASNAQHIADCVSQWSFKIIGFNWTAKSVKNLESPSLKSSLSSILFLLMVTNLK